MRNEVKIMKNKLATIVEQSGIELAKAESIWVSFEKFFEEASACACKVDDLEITDISQKDEMKLARQVRLELRNIRVAAEKKKKELKANVLKEGKFIDTTYNLIAEATKPIEADLLRKEKFAKRKEAERKEQLFRDRTKALQPFYVDTRFISLSDMDAVAFEQLLESSRIAYEERIEERAAREKAAAEERARIVAENERLRKEAEEKGRQIAEACARADAARKAAEDAANKEREAREAVERAERERQEAAVRKANEEAAEAQRLLREKEEEEERKRLEEQSRIAAQRKAEEDEQKRIESAGDKEKLADYFEQIKDVKAPSVNSDDAKDIIALMERSIHVCLKKIEKL
jgi:hypothetical protein